MAAKCANCGRVESAHCKECNACPGEHAGWCPKDR